MAGHFIHTEMLQAGVTYAAYLAAWEKKLNDAVPETLSEAERTSWEYRKLNFQRSQRVQKTYKMPEALHSAVAAIDQPQLWMVITEDWCGDSAQTLPVIAAIASINELIELKIIYRDAHPEIMDAYLTEGKRAIPVLVTFDESGRELFRWGPRPESAAALVRDSQAQGLTKTEFYPKLHLWYGRDRGKTVSEEFLELLQQSASELPIASPTLEITA